MAPRGPVCDKGLFHGFAGECHFIVESGDIVIARIEVVRVKVVTAECVVGNLNVFHLNHHFLFN
jgi:hypothetical protein